MLKCGSMSEFLAMVVAGFVIFVAIISLGLWISKRAKTSPRGHAATVRGWVYEGLDQWTCLVEGVYHWSARATSGSHEDSDDSFPLLEFDGRIFRRLPLRMSVSPRKRDARVLPHLIVDPSLASISSGDEKFDLIFDWRSDHEARARDVLTTDLISRWHHWPGGSPETLEIHVSSHPTMSTVTIRIPYRKFANDAEAEWFIEFGDQLVRNLNAT